MAERKDLFFTIPEVTRALSLADAQWSATLVVKAGVGMLQLSCAPVVGNAQRIWDVLIGGRPHWMIETIEGQGEFRDRRWCPRALEEVIAENWKGEKHFTLDTYALLWENRQNLRPSWERPC